MPLRNSAKINSGFPNSEYRGDLQETTRKIGEIKIDRLWVLLRDYKNMIDILDIVYRKKDK
jgi:hypothetical protein